MIVDSFEIRKIDPEYIRFRETARKILTGDPECLNELKQVVAKQDEIFQDPYVDPPYIFVAGSSGSGKTQFAMTVMNAKLEEPKPGADMRPVFYLPTNLIYNLESCLVQHIYVVFRLPCKALHRCLEDDMKFVITGKHYSVSSLADHSLYSFGFLRQLLRYGYSGMSHRILRCTASEVLDGYHGSPPILILDEFLPGKEERRPCYRLLCNLVRAARWRLIVTGTDTAAANVALPRYKRNESRGANMTYSCTIISKLPKYKPEYEVIEKQLPGTVRLILENSRPWFAHLFYKHWDADLPVDSEHLLKTCTSVGLRVRKVKLDRRAPEQRYSGQQGQLCMFLAQNYLDEWDSDPSKPLNLIHHHFAQLYRGGNTEPIHLDQALKHFVPKDGSSISFGSTKWKPRSYFPAPGADLLLHWGLGGIPGVEPFCGEGGHAISIAEAFRSYESGFLSDLDKLGVVNPKQKSKDGMKMEAIMTGAVCVASRCRGFGGASVLDFLEETLFQLTTNSNERPIVRRVLSPFTPLLEWHRLLVDIVIPFLPPPNQKWPTFVKDIPGTNFGRMERPENGKRVDILFGSEDMEFAAECEDHAGSLLALQTMIDVLNRIPESSQPKLHIIVCNKIKGKYFATKNNVEAEEAEEEENEEEEEENEEEGEEMPQKSKAKLPSASNEIGTSMVKPKLKKTLNPFVQNSCAFYRIDVDDLNGKLDTIKGLPNAPKATCVVIVFERRSHSA